MHSAIFIDLNAQRAGDCLNQKFAGSIQIGLRLPVCDGFATPQENMQEKYPLRRMNLSYRRAIPS